MPNYLVIGSSGYLGGQITKLIAPEQLIGTHHKNKKFKKSVAFDFFKDNPAKLELEGVDSVIFAAHVEMSEATIVIEKAMSAFLSHLDKQRLIYVSSDGIFEGSKGSYTEDDEAKPVTLYGRNLLACETLIKAQLPNYCIIRPSYIYGFSNDVLDERLARVKSSLLASETISAFHDMYKSPLHVRQVAKSILTLANTGFIGTLHVAGSRLSVYDFYKEAMTALNVNTRSLSSEACPDEPRFLKDTSLDSSKWQAMFGTRALSVTAALTEDV